MKKVVNNSVINAYKDVFGLHRPNLVLGEISIKIRRFFTDVDGVILDKNTVPQNLQVEYPFYLFGKMDYNGGFTYGNNVCPPVGGANYLQSMVAGQSIPFLLQFSGVNTIMTRINRGDMIQLFVDDLSNPNYYIWVLIGIPNRSYSSIVANMDEGSYLTTSHKYIVQNEDQYQQPVFMSFLNPFSEPNRDSYTPALFKNPNTQQDGFIKVMLEAFLTQYFGLYSYITFTNDEISFEFRCDHSYSNPQLPKLNNFN